MSNVINKNTLEYRINVNTPDYMDGNWIINPLLPNCESKYWKINGDQVVEMTQEEKNIINSQGLTAEDILSQGYTDSMLVLKLKCMDSDQAKFTSAVVVNQLGLQAGLLQLTSITTIWDYDNMPRELTIQDFLALMMRYSYYIQTVYKTMNN